MGLLARASAALVSGLIIAGVGLAFWFSESNGDVLGLISFCARYVHISAAMLWIGMIWFVNFIQLAALGSVDEAAREVLLKYIAFPVAALFRVASHVVVASGLGLLVTTGYLLDRWVFPSAVYISSPRGLMLWSGALGGLLMWASVHLVIWPNLRVIVDGTAGPQRLARARESIRRAARLNLMLAVPVTFGMVAAAHLY